MYYHGTYSSAFNNGNYFGSYRGTSQKISLPFTLSSVQYVNAEHIPPNTGFCIIGTLTNTSLTVWPYNRTNLTATQTGIKLMIEVVGRWK